MNLTVISTKIRKLYSGDEEGFYQFSRSINILDYVFHVNVLSMESIVLLDKKSLTFIIENQNYILKEETSNSISYKYKNLNVYYSINDKSNILGVFAIGEFQPARYEIFSLAFFSYQVKLEAKLDS